MARLGPYDPNTIVVGDCLQALRQIPDGVFQCVVTSPPYWGLRDYGIPPVVWGGEEGCEHEWNACKHDPQPHGDDGHSGNLEGGTATQAATRMGKVESAFCLRCNAWLGSLGLEPTPELYVEHIVEVFREVRRVLRDDGTLWLNMGDSYASQPAGNKTPKGFRQTAAVGRGDDLNPQLVRKGAKRDFGSLKPKDLIGLPWCVALALQADGWWLRSDIIWAKPNCMPESVRDRPTKAHEYVFLLAKSKRYFYDLEAIREEAKPWNKGKMSAPKCGAKRPTMGARDQNVKQYSVIKGANKRTVWTIPTHPFPEAHFATFPPKLVEPMIKAGTSERGACPECGKAWVRAVEKRKEGDTLAERPGTKNSEMYVSRYGAPRLGPGIRDRIVTIGWQPACDCWKETTDYLGVPTPEDPIPCIVLDPFAGAGTALMVADGLRRDWLGIDINPDYVEMALKRLKDDRKKRAQLPLQI